MASVKFETEYVLSEEDRAFVEQTVNQSQLFARSRGAKTAHGLNEERDGFYVKLLGYSGEFVLSKVLGGHWWTGEGILYGPGDVDELEARTIDADYKGLLVRESDDLTKKFVCLQGDLETGLFKILGWAYGWEVQQQGIRRESPGRGPFWTLDRRFLKSIDTVND